MMRSKPKVADNRFRWQFSLRAAVLLVVATALFLGWFGVELRTAWKQREAIQLIRNLGAITPSIGGH